MAENQKKFGGSLLRKHDSGQPGGKYQSESSPDRTEPPAKKSRDWKALKKGRQREKRKGRGKRKAPGWPYALE